MKESFSYAEYAKLVKTIRRFLPLFDFSDVKANTKKFCVIRHDVEFSVERAHQLAKFESRNLGIKTSYFFQLRNNAYNIFSEKDSRLISDIKRMGHKIGLHVNFGKIGLSRIKERILYDRRIMEECLGIVIDRFSYHRPPAEILGKNIEIDGLINPYSKKFFNFFKGQHPENLEVVYLSESNKSLEKRWPYGYPLDFLGECEKMQILTHPYQWSQKGERNKHKLFVSVLKEKKDKLINSMGDDCINFKLIKESVKKYEI
jgi:hypothetical protein